MAKVAGDSPVGKAELLSNKQLVVYSKKGISTITPLDVIRF